jgi:uncharacterized protein YegP (UPF0339 family)
MTRSQQVTQAAGTIREARAAADAAFERRTSMTFRVFEDNGGGFHWKIVAGSGETLGHSATFASYEEAKQAARIVRGSAGSAHFGERPGAVTVL